jgi:hypothetical protein
MERDVGGGQRERPGRGCERLPCGVLRIYSRRDDLSERRHSTVLLQYGHGWGEGRMGRRSFRHVRVIKVVLGMQWLANRRGREARGIDVVGLRRDERMW